MNADEIVKALRASLPALGIAPIGQVPAIIAYLSVGANLLNMAKEM